MFLEAACSNQLHSGVERQRCNVQVLIVAYLKLTFHTTKTWNMVFPYTNFNPLTQASLPEWLVSCPGTNLHLGSTPKITKPFCCKKGWGAQEAPKKNGHFSHFLGVNLQVSKSHKKSKWTKKQLPGRFVANAVTCVLFVYVVSLLVLQNHAEDLSRQWCGCILRF